MVTFKKGLVFFQAFSYFYRDSAYQLYFFQSGEDNSRNFYNF